MTQKVSYRYLGVNGVIDSPVHLEGIYSVKTISLVADSGMLLTKDGKNFVESVRVANEEEAAEWTEVKDNSN